MAERNRNKWSGSSGLAQAAVMAVLSAGALGTGSGIARADDYPPSPSVDAAGCRFLAVTPESWDNDVAILVVGLDGTNFGLEDVGCVELYVQSNGHLGSNPVYKSAAEWGTVYVHGPEIIPHAWYTALVQDELTEDFSPAADLATTWLWGDTNGSGTVNFADVSCVVDAFQGDQVAPCTFNGADVTGSGTGCPPNHIVNFVDVTAVIDAFQGQPFPCDKPCE